MRRICLDPSKGRLPWYGGSLTAAADFVYPISLYIIVLSKSLDLGEGVG